MALTQRLLIRQSQALVMTPQLMQAIRLLQLSNLDLVAYVEGELERNPLLDRSADDPEPVAEANGTPVEGGRRDGEWGDGENGAAHGAVEHRADASADDSFSDEANSDGMSDGMRGAEGPAGYSQWASVGAGRAEGDYNLEAYIPAETTLADWLRQQLVIAIVQPSQRMIGQYLIDLLDEAGYISADSAAVADKLGTSVKEVEAVLGILQSFDPTGICARDLAECLALQLKERNRFDPAMQALILRLDLVAKRDFAALKKLCGVGRRGSRRDDRGGSPPQSQTRARLWINGSTADRARRFCPAWPRWWLDRGA